MDGEAGTVEPRSGGLRQLALERDETLLPLTEGAVLPTLSLLSSGLTEGLATLAPQRPLRILAAEDKAVNQLLIKALLDQPLAQMDVIELNEAFATQGLAVLRMLGLQDDDKRVNAFGGAIALGHRLGASGTRLATTAVNRLHATVA